MPVRACLSLTEEFSASFGRVAEVDRSFLAPSAHHRSALGSARSRILSVTRPMTSSEMPTSRNATHPVLMALTDNQSAKGLAEENGQNGRASACIKASSNQWEYTPRVAPAHAASNEIEGSTGRKNLSVGLRLRFHQVNAQVQTGRPIRTAGSSRAVAPVMEFVNPWSCPAPRSKRPKTSTSMSTWLKENTVRLMRFPNAAFKTIPGPRCSGVTGISWSL
jgi:hypothetical protein